MPSSSRRFGVASPHPKPFSSEKGMTNAPEQRTSSAPSPGSFQPWALALGFAEESTLGKGQAGIIANPTRAVLDAFSHPCRVVWPKGEAMPVAEFVSLLLQEIPVMPGGVLAERSMLPSSVEGLGAPLSFALLAVETRKSILMEHRSDAATVVQVTSSDAARSMRAVSHVTVLEKKHA